jgi:hypothetical protein
MAKKKAGPEQVRIEYMPLSELVPAERNPKQHNLDALGDSIVRWGYVQPVTINEATGRLVAGHGRTEKLAHMKAAGEDAPGRVQVRKKDGEWLVPVVRGVSFANDQEAEAYLLADNRLTEIGHWDEELLGQVLSEFAEVGPESFVGLGWDMQDVVTMETEKELADLKMAPVGIAAENTAEDPRSKQFWVWAACESAEQMQEVVARFGKPGKGKTSRELDIALIMR